MQDEVDPIFAFVIRRGGKWLSTLPTDIPTDRVYRLFAGRHPLGKLAKYYAERRPGRWRSTPDGSRPRRDDGPLEDFSAAEIHRERIGYGTAGDS